jgi:hypothetical protein
MRKGSNSVTKELIVSHWMITPSSLFLRGVREEFMETLNLLENGDIFQLEYEYIKKVFKNYSRSTRKEE